MLEFDGRTVVITGGATGIGLALAKACGSQGAHIVIGEPRPQRLEEAVAELEALGITARSFQCDVTRLEEVEAFADFAFDGGRDVALVINNAGVAQQNAAVVDTPPEEVHRVFDVNFFGVWHGCRVFGRRLTDQGTPAAIYNTGSENALFVAVVNAAAYVASKHAVYGLTDALREEMPDHVTVGMIAPGFVASELIPEQARSLGMPAEEFATIALAQIRAGAFHVVSHSYNQVHVDQRHAELSKAFADHAPRHDGDERYDVRTLRARSTR